MLILISLSLVSLLATWILQIVQETMVNSLQDLCVECSQNKRNRGCAENWTPNLGIATRWADHLACLLVCLHEMPLGGAQEHDGGDQEQRPPPRHLRCPHGTLVSPKCWEFGGCAVGIITFVDEFFFMRCFSVYIWLALTASNEADHQEKVSTPDWVTNKGSRVLFFFFWRYLIWSCGCVWLLACALGAKPEMYTCQKTNKNFKS